MDTTGPTGPVEPPPAVDSSVFYAGLLASSCAGQRAWGIARWTEHLGDDQQLVPLLQDDAPVIRVHAGSRVLVEVRALALVALQDRHRGVGGWPFGPVTVRRAMTAGQAVRRAAELLGPLAPDRRADLLRRVDLAITTRVEPAPDELETCRAYLALQALGAVPYLRQQVDPVTLLTPVQVEIDAGRLRGTRPTPHLRVDGRHRPLGYVLLHDRRWVVDTDESPAGRDLADLIDRIRRIGPGGGVPRVRFAPGGEPLRAPDGSFRVDGVLPEDDGTDFLLSLAAFVSRQHPCEVVLDAGHGRRLGPEVFVVEPDDPVPAAAPGWSSPPEPVDVESVLGAVDNQAGYLSLAGRGLTELPPSIGRLVALEQLVLEDNALERLPDEIGDLTDLTELYLGRNRLTRLPATIGRLDRLGTLDLQDNRLSELPDQIGGLCRLFELDLTGNRLTGLPEQLGDLVDLEVLDLTGNPLTRLPDRLADLRSLRVLLLAGHRFERPPSVLDRLTWLDRLDLG